MEEETHPSRADQTQHSPHMHEPLICIRNKNHEVWPSLARSIRAYENSTLRSVFIFIFMHS